jgi:hypothetical protein
MSKFKQVRPLLGFSAQKDGAVLARGVAVHDAMLNNPAYPSPPVDLKALEAALVIYGAAIAAALDGGQKAITARESARDTVVKMLLQLGAYAQTNCKDDSAIFMSSGFAAASSARGPAQPLDKPDIRKIDQGITGQLLVSITPIPGARSYELRSGLVTNGTPGPWTTDLLTKGKTPVPYSNLTPGATYAFQVRAMGKLGFTDWSDPATRMCI